MSSFLSNIFCVGLVTVPLTLISGAEAQANAAHAKCQINVRLIEAIRANPDKKKRKKDTDKAASLSSDESKQLENLPFGSYSTLDQKTADTSSFTSVNFDLATGEQKDSENFTVSVTPHSLADNKVHYTLEWSTPQEKSVVATRLGIENGRSIFIGASLSSDLNKPKTKNTKSYVIGVKVTCHG